MSVPFSIGNYKANLRKNVFDLSEKSLFSSSAGMLLPVMCKEVNPGEKFQLSVVGLTRTQPLNTAAFVRMRQYYHYFFVPFNQLWRGWDNFINGVDYKTSALESNAFKSTQYTQVPGIDLFGSLVDLFNAHKFSINEGLSTNKDEFGYFNIHGASRLLDMLGYGFSLRGFDGVNAQASTLWEIFANVLQQNTSAPPATRLQKLKQLKVRFNPFRLLAYQKIYSDFYKNDDYEATNPLAFNIDDFDGSKSITDADRIASMLKIRYRWLPKDYFTGIVPSELAGLDNALSGQSGVAENMGLNIRSNEHSVDVVNSGAFAQDGNYSVTTKSIRSAFALEKLLRITRRAGGFDYMSQTEAHYGVEVPKGRGTDVQFLGGFTSHINISEVLSQADVGKASVGSIYGKGVGVFENNKPIEFEAKQHGIIMCISSVVPELDYSAEGVEKFNAKFYRGDYFLPEFQDLGMQPVFGFELLNFWTNTQYTNSGTSSDLATMSNSGILGYVPRYAEYKASYDRLHGEFRNGRSLSAWSASSLLSFVGGVVPHTLKINPKCLDRIFATNFDGKEKTDQFMHSVQFITKAIRPMSVSGQNI